MIALLAAGLLLVAPTPRPNVLFVLADDLAHDAVRALGNPDVHTPTLDALAGRGFVCRNAYNQESMIPAVCAPSRTMILTGRHLFRIPDPRVTQYAGPTLGATFRQAGYATACVSKPGNSFLAGHRAFETVVHQPHAGADTMARTTDAAIQFVGGAGDRPFFLYFAPTVPHDPRTAEARFHARYKPDALTLPRNFRPTAVPTGDPPVRDELLAAVPRDPAAMRHHLADYYACVTGFDHHLGRLLDAVRTAGKLDTTLVVVTSDQGLAVGGRHGLMGKQHLYEHTKPPLVVAGPGVRPGRSEALAYLFDLNPTLCELAGVMLPDGLDGRSLAGVLAGSAMAVRPTVYAVYRDTQRMVRDARWKLLWYPKAGRTQLFDLQADPYELHDRGGDPAHADTLARLRRELADRRAAFADDRVPAPGGHS